MAHDIKNYRRGCSCEVCRAAKAAYMRELRAATRALRLAAEAEGRQYVAQGIKHGLSGYLDYSCRCFVCRLAPSESRRRRKEAAAGERGDG